MWGEATFCPDWSQTQNHSTSFWFPMPENKSLQWVDIISENYDYIAVNHSKVLDHTNNDLVNYLQYLEIVFTFTK